jgi:hypothetical protein
MGFMTGYRSPTEEDPEEKRKRLIAESMTSDGRQVGPDMPTLYDTGAKAKAALARAESLHTGTMRREEETDFARGWDKMAGRSDTAPNYGPPDIQSSADAVEARSKVPDITPPVERGSGETLDRFADWAKRMPREDDPRYKAGRGRKILGGVVAGLASLSGRPGVGIGAWNAITKSKYNKAADEWTREGSALKDVASVDVQRDRLAQQREKEAGVGGRFGQKEERITTQFGESQQLARDKLQQEMDVLELKEGGLNKRDNNRLTFLRDALKVKQTEGAADRSLKASEGEKNRTAAGERQDKYLGSRRLPVPPSAKRVLQDLALTDPRVRDFVDEDGIVDSADIDDEDRDAYNEFIANFNKQRTSVNPVSRY